MKMVVTLSRIPFPLEKGDKLRAYHQIKSMIEAGNEVHVICFHFEKATSNQLQALQTLGGHWYFISLSQILIPLSLLKGIWSQQPWQVLLFHQRHAHRQFESLIEIIRPDVIYSQMIRTTEYSKNFHDIPKTLDYMDALSLGLKKRCQKSHWLTRWFWKDEFERVSKYEKVISHYFDQLTIISQKDANSIALPDDKKFEIISNGIDFDFFSANNSKHENAVIFTGNMNYPPNVDAALRLGLQIMPLLWKKLPNVKLIIAGAEPHRSLQQNLKDSRIEITGWMDDIRKAYERGNVFVAPMTLGSGMQNKILEALSMGLPVVCSDIAAEAFDEELKKILFVADSDDEYVDNIISLLNQEFQHSRPEVQTIIQSKFSWTKATEPLLSLLRASSH
jgi:glycosyltransferase involved in cell wall biosynthesis